MLNFESDASREARKQQVRERALTLAEAAGKPLTWSAVADAFEQGFASAYGLDMAARQLSPSEFSRAKQLIAERFGNPAWTRKR